MVINASKSESLRSKYDLDIEQLDYKFIRTCEKVKTVENILKVLRSGQEGVYPDLVRFTEERLRALKPGSSLLRIERPATSLCALNCELRDELLSDLEKWKHDVATADAELKSSSSKPDFSDCQLPPVRGTVQLNTEAAKEPSPTPLQKLTRIPSHDYAAWDRYDVDAQLKLLDDSETDAAPEQLTERNDPAIDDQPPVEGLSAGERDALALRERQKGNEYFRSGDFSRAAVYYTRSINASPTVAAFNNRAQANLKLGKYGSALLDAGAVLRREPRNVKALLRRGIARQMTSDWIKARADFQRVLQLEPNNPQARQHLDRVDRAIIGSETKRSKVLIQEVDSIEEESVSTSTVVTVSRDDHVNDRVVPPNEPEISSDRAESLSAVPSIPVASYMETKTTPGEDEGSNPEIQPPGSIAHGTRNRTVFHQLIGSSHNSNPTDTTDAIYKHQNAQKENTRDKNTNEVSDDLIKSQTQPKKISNMKISPNDADIAIDIISKPGGNDTDAGLAAGIPDQTEHLPERVVHLPEPAAELPDPVVPLPEPAAEQLPEPVAELPERVVHLPEPAVELPEPAAELPEPVVHLPEPAAELLEPVVPLPEPAVELPERTVQVPGLTAKLLEPTRQLSEPVKQFAEPPSEDGDARPHLPMPSPQEGRAAGPVAPRRWRPAEFLCACRAARRSDGRGLAMMAELLRSVEPGRLPELLGLELDSDILSTVIRCAEERLLAEAGPERCRRLLEALTRASRFDAVRLLLGGGDRARLRTLADTLRSRGTDPAPLLRRFLG